MGTKQILMLTYIPNDVRHSWRADNNLDVYTNNPVRAASLPRPDSLRPGDARITLTPAQIMQRLQAVDVSDSTTLTSAVSKLLDHFSVDNLTDADKVCLLYEWLIAQDVQRKTFLLTSNFETVTFQLRKLQQGENSYAAMFMNLCNMADIPCVVVHGLLKAGPGPPGKGEWNAVYVDGHWRLVDSFWGSVSRPSLYPSQHYLFPDPEQFKYSHWSETKLWQLLPVPLTQPRFEHQEYLSEKFFRMNMAVIQSRGSVLTSKDGQLEIDFCLNDMNAMDQAFHCYLSTYKDEKPVTVPLGKQMDLTHKKKKPVTQDDTRDGFNPLILEVWVHFQNKGEYKLEICGESQNEMLDLVAVYKVNVTGIQKSLFPAVDMKGWGPSYHTSNHGFKAKSHPSSIIEVDTPILNVEFELIKPSQMTNVKLTYQLAEIDGSCINEDLTGGTRQGNVVSVKVKAMGFNNSTLNISAVVNGENIDNICTYYIDTHIIQANDQYQDMVKCLKSAIKCKQLEKLKEAVDYVQTKNYDIHPKVTNMFQTAATMYEELKTYQKNLANIQSVDTNITLALKSYSNPDPVIVKVMRATFLVLGTPMRDLKDWESIRKELTDIGDASVKRRIAKVQVEDLDWKVVEAAEREMVGVNAVQLTGTSKDIASFAKWLESIFQVCRQRTIQDDEEGD